MTDFNFSNMTTYYTDYELDSCTVPFSSVVKVCSDWKNVSTYAHNTYAILIGLYWLIRWIQKIYNPKITHTYNDNTFGFILKYFNNKYKKPIMKTETFFIFDEIKDILRFVVFARIIQVWYIMHWVIK